MGLEDRDALRVLRDAFAPQPDLDHKTQSSELVRSFYTNWFSLDSSVRDLFPPEMSGQRAAFTRALHWVYSELVAQRAEEPIAFLAQLGRDHRKYGVQPTQYETLRRALQTTLRSHLGSSWTDSVARAAEQSLNLIVGVMSGAADSEDGPAWWDATVIEHIPASRDLAVIRLQLDHPMPYHPGQYVNVQVPQCPRRWRYLSPAIPADLEGRIEFHVRVVPGGLVSTAMVNETRTGDRWRLASPHGGLHVDRTGGDVLMVAGSTGLAPLRALILDMGRFVENPRVHLFFGARYFCELYDLRTLWQVAAHNPWLSVSPVAEYKLDPSWATDYPDVSPPRGLHVRQTGRLAEVVTNYGNWGDRQILICGGPAMVRTTKAALIAKGAPRERIQHDPLP
ncbi:MULTISPECIES: FAD-binding oxidoreductase [Mycobacterium ulcerans group]|uniref:nitric oxide dioxygenase n=1 Tax=Mycobacterium marinum (strain ATCC BAA-535 / M) TaxID=216594 RepID=B2HPS8_MYCMM|nr:MULTISPECIES: FAD-binding oxidoreductase [Mycobacterium ulcerans group]ACC39105.1 monooxygenase [Mycobacterium marinum M]EPQ71409.1 oxidoreductase [Mycobacterium marinum MB2]MDC8971443.1 FAD-binding oxidoreductase [Mycobacterium marinum]MDC8981017.1 FAD-binding oxidoreductase [Mycobacterium marinum]MDC8993730.1 FAD-binding oxidoreductase [Mycobacterium marinum]